MRGNVVTVSSSAQGSLSWTVRGDVAATKSPPDVEYDNVGIRGFHLNNEEVKTGCRKNNCCVNLLKLFIHLWPNNYVA